ncbi:MAG TPA: hypothetical protein VD862_00845 [Candidatus Paceibacterota bacterium]|nr:hypothetical protein [Candidatus Paceibacterota bacterium]
MEHAPETTESAERFARPEIAELATPLAFILDRLQTRIEGGVYGAIIGDDSSGRIPALIMDRVLRERYRTLGHPVLETRFAAGSGSGYTQIEGQQYDDKVDALRRLVAGLGGGRRVLIVTDVVVSGKSLEPLMVALTLEGVPFDVAATGYAEEWGKGTAEMLRERFGAELIAGGTQIFPPILNRPDLSGVKKQKPETHARPAKDEIKGFLFREGKRKKFQRNLNEVRDDIAAVADVLLERYLAGF